MIAVDTNILVRLITGDDPDQAERALALSVRDVFFVSFTVLVETEWVLRSAFGYDRARICRALDELGNLIQISYEQEQDARWAIERFALGGELADYLHIAAARPVGRFASFERRLKVRAGEGSPAVVEILV